MTMTNALKGLGWLLLLVAVVASFPLIIHVLHLGMLVIKLVVEAAFVVVLFALGIWLARR